MRIRKKKWAQPELDACPYYIPVASELAGKWDKLFGESTAPVYLELGCGKGGFAAQSALLHPDVNYIAMDIKSDMLGVARRTIEKAFAEAGKTPENIRLISQNIEMLRTACMDEQSIDRIYINFCNPWPKKGHKKRRLTHTRQLMQYRPILKDGCEIHFKTDDDELFEESLEYFAESGFEIKYITRDLHTSGYEFNVMTEHEKMFMEEGKKIKFLIAVKSELPKNDMSV